MSQLLDPDPALHPLLASAFDQLANAAMITDTTGRIVWANAALCQLSGYSAHELVGRTPAILKSGQQDAAFYAQLWQTVMAGQVWHGKLVEARKDGTEYTAEQVITPIRDAGGKITHFAALQQDVSQREAAHQRDLFLSRHDPLTGLPNRHMLHESLRRALSLASRSRQELALMFIDLDGFKEVNDRLGHQVGDQLLAAVAERLRTGVRQSDTIARIGGDEFVVLIPTLDCHCTAAALAGKLRDTLGAPFVVRGHRLAVRASIGIAVFPQDGMEADILLEHADEAMYRAKQLGGNNCLFHEPDQALPEAHARADGQGSPGGRA